MTIELIANKFRVLKPLGQGAMGDVYLVLPPRGDPVALKLLKAQDGEHQKGAMEQFENEFKVLKKLSHPNIGRIFDYGYDEELKKVYFTSPWLRGSDLYHTVKDCSYEELEELIVQVLRALNYLHQKKIIHCDLKPGNIFVEKGQVLLIDFGLAGYWGESIVGTPTYLAPEIFRGQHHSVSSDLYALGVILYNCLTRTQPFSGKTLQEVYDRHRSHTPVPIHQLNPKVPKYLSDVALTLLSKRPEERYPNVVAVIEELAAYSKKPYRVETAETLLSYLPKHSELIGRGDVMWRVETQLESFLKRDQPNFRGLFLHGEHGCGKSKFVGQIKSSLQLAKVQVEEAVLPIKEGDRKILEGAEAIILEDIDSLLDAIIEDKSSKKTGVVTESVESSFQEFLSFLEQKLLSPDTSRFLFIVTGTDPQQWESFSKLFPEEDFHCEQIQIFPFNQVETRIFLETIIGNKEIPKNFIEEVYRNTEGNPGLCQQIVEHLIQQGLLFDQSGRWSTDLLSHLEGILKKIDPPKSLEQRLDREYSSFDDAEKEIVHFLALSPHGFTKALFAALIHDESLDQRLATMVKKRIIRMEGDEYFLYRSAFAIYLQKFIPLKDQQRLHQVLASEQLHLELIHRWFHQSHQGDPLLMQEALEKLGETLALKGEKERALECYQRLNKAFLRVPIPQRLKWAIKASEILIWLDRFTEAEGLLTEVENEIYNMEESIPIKDRLTLLEKKGLSLLHMHKLKQASFYFIEGLRLASDKQGCSVEQIRALNNMAQIEMITGRHESAIEKFLESRRQSVLLSTEESRLVTNNDLGHVFLGLKKYDAAIAALTEDIAIFATLPFHEPETRARYSLAECYRALKKFSLAVKEYEVCIQICQREHLLPVLLRAYNGLGNLYLVNGKYEQALDNYQRAIEISVRLNDTTTKAALLANQGLIYRQQAIFSQAARRFHLAKQILESKGGKLVAYESHLLCKCYNELAAISRETHDSMKAISFQVEQIKLVEQFPTLNSEKFQVRMDLAGLYLENRLEGPFSKEVEQLKELASSEEEKKKVRELELKWLEVKTYLDQENTSKLATPME